MEWNNLDQVLTYNKTFSLYRCNILKFIKLLPNSFFKCQNISARFVTRLCLEILAMLCNCRINVESFFHFLLQYSCFLNERCTLMSNFNKNDLQVSKLTLPDLPTTLLFGNPSFSDKTNTRILNATIEYILSTKRFDETASFLSQLYYNSIYSNLYFGSF